jgi:hypothetical protein
LNAKIYKFAATMTPLQLDCSHRTDLIFSYIQPKQVPVAARSKVYVYGRSPAAFVGSHTTGGMDVCLLCGLCVVRQRSLRRTDHSSREVLPGCGASLCVIKKPRVREGHSPRWAAEPEKIINNIQPKQRENAQN